MELKEKIRKVYQKEGVKVEDDYIEYKMQNKEKIKWFERTYEEEKISLCSSIDLFNKKTIELCRKIYLKEKLDVSV